jgi:hypothetical protein
MAEIGAEKPVRVLDRAVGQKKKKTGDKDKRYDFESLPQNPINILI